MKQFNFDFEKHKNLIIAVILVVIFVLDMAFLLRPQIGILIKLSSKVFILSKNLRNARKDIASQKELESKLALLKVRMKDFSSTVTPQEELPSTLEEISRMANKTFVKITQIKPVKEEKTPILKTESGIYYKIPILIDAQCSFHALGKFLNELENGAVLMKIVGLEITSNPSDAMRHLARLSIQLFVFGK